MTKLILLAAVAALSLAAQASVFEIHALEAAASAKTKTYTIDNAGHKLTVNLNNDVLIDRSALSGAQVTQRKVAVTSGAKPEQKTVPEITLMFTNAGAGKVKEVSTALLGKQVGVIIDGKLIATPEVREALRRSSLTLAGNFTKEEADAMVAKIKSGK